MSTEVQATKPDKKAEKAEKAAAKQAEKQAAKTAKASKPKAKNDPKSKDPKPKGAKNKGAEGGTKVFGITIGGAPKELEGPDHEAQFVPTLPTVNLLPDDVLETVQLRRLRRLMVGVAAGALGGVAALYMLQGALIASAEKDLAEAESESTAAVAQMNALLPFQTYYVNLDQKKIAIQTVMSTEVLTSEILEVVQDPKTIEGITFEDVQLVVNGPAMATPTGAPTAGGGSCLSPDPFNPAAPSVGCVLVSGTATSHIALAQWMERADAEPLFTEVYVPGTTSADNGATAVSFTASLGLNPIEALRPTEIETSESGADTNSQESTS